MSSAAPTRTQQVLIYLGLAKDPSESEQERKAKDATWLIVSSILVTVYLWDEEGRAVAIAIGLLLLPPVLLVAGTKLGAGRIRAFCGRHVGLAESVAAPVVLCGFAWLIVPSATSDWIPIAIGGAVALLSLASAAADRLASRRQP